MDTIADTQNSGPDTADRTVQMPEELTRGWVESATVHATSPGGVLRLDFRDTVRIDSAGAALVSMLHRLYGDAGGRVVLANISDELLGTLQKWTGRMQTAGTDENKQRPGLLERFGSQGIAFWEELVHALSVLVEIIYWGTFGLLKRRDIKKGALGEQMFQLGYRALIIVSMLAFLIGMVLALQTAIQLRLYGADIFLAPMIGISMIRELGPLMTAIILAGRTGSATTAEIATMGVQEELDALRTMSINPIQFVAVPKFWAITLTMPMLSVIAMVSGIFGGYLVAVLYLGTAPSLFMGELLKNIYLNDFLAGFIKSIVFSWLIVWIGTYYGLKVRGGAEEVGRMTTASVVTGIFVIIIADAIFSFII
jgi:phospholipid/cholesterol/gamma-HCH transport system permease protein